VVDHELRFLPTVQTMRSLLRAQYCGTLFYLRLTINSPRMLSDRVRLNIHTQRDREMQSTLSLANTSTLLTRKPLPTCMHAYAHMHVKYVCTQTHRRCVVW
jgi:hypothetical protein